MSNNVTALLLNFFLITYGRGTFAHVTFTLGAVFLIGLPLLVFNIIFECCMKRKNEISPIIWRVVLIIFLQLISVEMGQVCACACLLA